MVNYTVEAPEPDPYLEEEVTSTGPVTRRIDLKLITPWEAFRLFTANGMLECDENVYKGDLRLRTDRSSFIVSANVEVSPPHPVLQSIQTYNYRDGAFVLFQTDEEYLNANVGLEMTTPTFAIPALKVLAKKDFASSEKSIDVALVFLAPLSKTVLI